MAPETSQTLDRGLRVLAALAGHPAGLTVSDLAGAVGVNRTVVYRLVTTLEQHGLARRDPAGLVRVGLGVLGLARGVQPVLRELANPVLRSLADDLGATAHLTVADGSVRIVSTVGELQPGARGLAAPVLGVDGLEASVGVVTVGDLDSTDAGQRVAAAAADLARRLR